MMHGSHAERAAVPAGATWLVPEGVSFEHAACVPVAWGTAHDCLFEFGRLAKGESVLVQAGSSGVGLACVQLAKRAGAIVYATASREKFARLAEFGVDHPIAYREVDFADAIRELTSGRGVDLVVDSVGGDTLQRSLHVPRLPRARDQRRQREPRRSARRPRAALAGKPLAHGRVPRRRGRVPDARVRAMLDAILRDLARGELRTVVDRTFPLAQAAAAHAYIESRAAFGRVVLIP